MKRKILFYKLLQILLVVVCFCGRCDGQIISTFAGTGIGGGNTGDGGSATSANIDYPVSGVFDKFGNYYVATGNVGHGVRKITSSGIITTVAGNGTAGFSGDNGQATAAQLNNVQAVAVDTSGDLYIADAGNNRVRKVDVNTGIITTIAGTGVASYGGDGGPATAAKLYDPIFLCFDKYNNLYISDYANHRIRKVNPAGTISTVAGNGVSGYGGTGVPATSVSMAVWGICCDNAGNLYIADDYAYVFKVNLAGTISYYAGNGTSGSNGDGGLATSAQTAPMSIVMDKFDNLFIGEQGVNKVRLVKNSGIITAVAGTGIAASGGDGGSASSAELNYPDGLAVDSCGNLYISTGHDWRIRKVTYPHCNYLSVQQVEDKEETVLFPNPVTTELNINITVALESVVITNMIGQVVYSGKEKSVDVAYLKPGMYFVMVNNEFSAKFVKE